MKIVTFYSFRGGVGRSLAVANVSHLMVESRERRVLMVDFDLEAPGLSFMPHFCSRKASSKGGIFEFALAFQKGFQPRLADYIGTLEQYGGNLDLVRAGDLESGKYSVGDISVKKLLNTKRAGGDFVTYFRREVEALKYHYVLIDSRTGLTETSGLCTVALADFVIVLTGLNHQNQEGTKWVLQNLRQKTDGLRRTIVAFSHVPNSEEELKAKRISEARKFLGLDGIEPVVLFYHPRVSLEEELFVDRWKGAPLTQSYRQLAHAIYDRNTEDIEQLESAIYSSRRWRTAVADEDLKRQPAGSNALDDFRRKCLDLYPANARLQRALAQQYYDLGFLEEAAQLFEEAFHGTERFDERPEATFIQCLLRLADVDRLRAEFDRLALTLQNMPAGIRHRAVGFIAVAIDELESDLSLRSRFSTDEKTPIDNVRILAHKRTAELALSAIESEQDISETTQLLLEAAREYRIVWQISCGALEIARAIELYQKAEKLNPDDVSIKNILGTTFWKSGQLQKAQQVFARALKKDPHSAPVLSNDAELAVVQGNHARFRKRADSIFRSKLPHKQAESEYLVIMHFLKWLIEPGMDPSELVERFKKLRVRRPLTWDFSDIRVVIEKLDESKRAIAENLIRFFKDEIESNTVEQSFALAKRQPRLL